MVILSPDKRLLALTFDPCETSGEVAGYDGAIIDYLRAHRVKATFFAGGRWMASHSERTQRLLSDPLFEVGTHGWGHLNTRLLSGNELKREILAPASTYVSLRRELGKAQCAAPFLAAFSSIPDQPKFFRFPFGACNDEGLQAVSDAGLVATQWDVSSGDPSSHQSASAIASLLVRKSRPGSIIIAHANGRGYHAEALPMVIPALRVKGFEFVTISELLAAGEPVVVNRCYDTKPGDTDRYDALVPVKRKPSEPRTCAS